MHFLGRQLGRRHLLQRGGVDRLAIGQAPRAVTGPGGRLQRLDRRDLPVERRIDAAGHDPGRACLPVAGDIGRLGAADERLDQRRILRRFGAQLAHLAERQLKRPIGGEEAPGGLGALLGGFLVKNAGERVEPREIGLGIPGRADRMRRVQEVRRAEIGAALLKDRIGPHDAVDPVLRRRDRLRLQRIGDDVQVQAIGGR